MSFNIVHIVSNLDKINFGIWNAAINGSQFLQEVYGVRSCLWVCRRSDLQSFPVNIPVTYIDNELNGRLDDLAIKEKISKDNTVIVTHGAWLAPTRIGCWLKKMGFNWIYVPHGMLEPWSMSQGKLKKYLYYYLREKRLANRANAIRAVSSREQQNLKKKFQLNVELVENGADVPEYPLKDPGMEVFLFMGRLHFKKGILPLAKAWQQCMEGSNKKLIIAGPDEGELEKIQPYLNETIQYAGPVYGEKKITLLKTSHYYLLPSFSEGFPTSVVEAMSYGLIPLISEGCNFPEVFSNKLGYRVEPDTESLQAALTELKEKRFDRELSFKNHLYIKEHYSTERIGQKLFNLYEGVMKHKQTRRHGSLL